MLGSLMGMPFIGDMFLRRAEFGCASIARA
jgi:hypothetical protein